MSRSEKTFPPRKRRLSATARRALEVLASDPRTESIMLAHGFTSRTLSDLVDGGLAMLYRAPLNIGNRTVDVTYMMITVAGRRALEG